jgi:hypothetical protein
MEKLKDGILDWDMMNTGEPEIDPLGLGGSLGENLKTLSLSLKVISAIDFEEILIPRSEL